jgi:hypothetical protein
MYFETNKKKRRNFAAPEPSRLAIKSAEGTTHGGCSLSSHTELTKMNWEFNVLMDKI